MAKLTVYIPDDLLDRARALDPGANTSQIVQRGLECLSPGKPVAYAQRPADADTLVAGAAATLRARAAREYEQGYRAALAAVSKVGEVLGPVLEDLADIEFDLCRWASEARDRLVVEAALGTPTTEPSFNPPEWFWALIDDLGTLIDPIGREEWSFRPSRALLRGYEAALRDAWNAVERPLEPDDDAPDAEPQREVPNPEP